MGVSAPENRADQLEQLRKRMAAISGRVGSSHRGPGATTARALPDTAPESLLPVPESLLGVLPDGLPRGSVTVTSGARSLPLGMAAAVTAAGGHAAIVGLPGAGLLAAAEMGADLSRIAMIPDPGPDPVEVAAVLTDGMDLVLLGMTVVIQLFVYSNLWETHALWAAGCLFLILRGPGVFSLDHLIRRRVTG